MEDERKKHLLESAADIFREKGYKTTNISDITRKAGMAVGSFYKYYNSKEEVFLEVYVRENNALRMKVAEKLDWSQEPHLIMKDFFRMMAELNSGNNILSEWNGPWVSDILHDYYKSEQGKNSYNFNTSVRKELHKKLIEFISDEEEIDRIMGVYDLIYYLDCTLSPKTQKNLRDSLESLTYYFVRGLAADANKP